MRMSRKLAVCAIALCALILSGCAQVPMSAVIDTSVQSFQPIPVDAADTCATQREIAGHNSVYDTLEKGKEVAYCAPCDCPEQYPKRNDQPKAVS